MSFTTLTLLLTFVVFIYLYVKKKHSYWKTRGIPYKEPEFLIGNSRQQLLRSKAFGDIFAEVYNEFKSKGYKHVGIYSFLRPVYMPIDMELLKCIIQKDFSHFVNHGLYSNEEVDPLTGHLFNLEDEKWRNMRVKLTPTFTSGKMKMMFQTMKECSHGLTDILNGHAILQDTVDIKDLVSRFTTDVIGSCAFGIDCNSLKDPDSEFRRFSRRIFEPSIASRLKNMAFFLLPREFLDKIRIKQTSIEVETFFMKVVKDTVEYREKNKVYRKDFMQLLLEIKNTGKVKDDSDVQTIEKVNDIGQSLTINEIAAQCFVFFLAGFETSATTITFAMLELALNPEIQDRLRKEIKTVLKKYNGEITYESVMEMTYLDRVIHETLRRHPPLPGTPRVCTKDYKIPGTDIILEKGTRIHIPVQAIQKDPEYYPDPEKFDPDRFSEENKAKRPACAFLPFGEGPRICIGSRFGLMQAKIGTLTIIRDFDVRLDKKTQTPVKYATKTFFNSIEGGVWLNVSKIEDL